MPNVCVCVCVCRHRQQGAAVSVHRGDAAEDVQSGPGPLLRGVLQPLRLLRGVRRHRGDHPGGDGDHASAGHLCAALRPAAQDLQGDAVRGASADPRVLPTLRPLGLETAAKCCWLRDDLRFPCCLPTQEKKNPVKRASKL